MGERRRGGNEGRGIEEEGKRRRMGENGREGGEEEGGQEGCLPSCTTLSPLCAPPLPQLNSFGV